MANNLECEVKALVSKEDFDKLMNVYSASGEIREQNNIYFGDAKGIFGRLKYGMRIRSKSWNDKLTLKVPQDNGLLEVNQLISKEEMSRILAGNFLPEGAVKDELAKVNVAPSDLKIIGRLFTKRLLVRIGEYELCLDENTYNGRTDYEVEVEGPSVEAAREFIKNVLEKEKIPFIENHLSKYLRATR